MEIVKVNETSEEHKDLVEIETPEKPAKARKRRPADYRVARVLDSGMTDVVTNLKNQYACLKWLKEHVRDDEAVYRIYRFYDDKTVKVRQKTDILIE